MVTCPLPPPRRPEPPSFTSLKVTSIVQSAHDVVAKQMGLRQHDGRWLFPDLATYRQFSARVGAVLTSAETDIPDGLDA